MKKAVPLQRTAFNSPQTCQKPETQFFRVAQKIKITIPASTSHAARFDLSAELSDMRIINEEKGPSKSGAPLKET
jgi:hypothetical protein